MAPRLALRIHAQPLSVVRLDAERPVPDWAFRGPGIAACVRRGPELGVVCASDRVPPSATREDGWVALEVDGPLDFALTGVLVAIAAPLAEAGVSIYALSTYDTDLVLVRAEAVDDATAALTAVGHTVSRVS